jgi:hypothetical protein
MKLREHKYNKNYMKTYTNVKQKTAYKTRKKQIYNRFLTYIKCLNRIIHITIYMNQEHEQYKIPV